MNDSYINRTDMKCIACGTAIVKKGREGMKQLTARKFCSRACSTRTRMKDHPINSITTRYRTRKINGKNISEHRAVVQATIGRELKSHEYVHHIDGNKLNNSIENLEVTDALSHGREHNLRKPLTYACAICDSVFEPHKTKRGRNKTCSRQCRFALIRRSRWGR